MIAHWNQSTHLTRFLEDIQSNGINILRRKLEARRSDVAFQIAIGLTLLFSGCFLIHIINTRLFGKLPNALVDIKQLADRDALTKLLSRRSLQQLLDQSISWLSVESEGLGLCILDIEFLSNLMILMAILKVMMHWPPLLLC